MATYNGRQWIESQVSSILKQQDADITLFISDDDSLDGTNQWIEQLESYAIRVLPASTRRGSAGRNFYRLIRDVDFSGFDYIAFADQDDIWHPDKLIRHIALAKLHDADGVSSDVTAFWPDGRTRLIRKSQPQREFDYLFESAGPGCTFLMTPRLVGKVQALLRDPASGTAEVTLHDWLTYAVCRSSGYRWHIDAQPSLLYRQHGNNVLGANTGLKTRLARLRKLRDGWYRQQVKKVTHIAFTISGDPRLLKLSRCLDKTGLASRLCLIPYVWQGRRSLSERIYLIGAILFKWF